MLARLFARYLNYSTRHYLKQKVRHTDFRFVLALIGLIVVALMAMRYYR